jgi:hypothetical protein
MKTPIDFVRDSYIIILQPWWASGGFENRP